MAGHGSNPSQAAQLQSETRILERAFAERVRQFAERSAVGAQASPLGYMLLAWIEWATAGPAAVALWLMLVGTTEAWTLWLSRRYAAAAADAAQARKQLNALTWSNLAVGLAWGASVWIFWRADEIVVHMMNVCILIAMAGLSLMTVSTFLRSIVAFASGVLVPVIIHGVWHPYGGAFQVLTGLVIVWLMVMEFGRVAGLQVAGNIERGMRNDALTERLSVAHEQLSASHDELEAKNSELMLTLESLNLSETHLQLILNSTSEAIYGTDLDGVCTFVNQSCLRLLGYTDSANLVGQYMESLLIPASTQHGRLPEARYSIDTMRVSLQNLMRADGSLLPVERWSRPMYRDGEIVGSVITFVDITERKRAQERIQFLACHDALTELPNRVLLRDRFERACADTNVSGRHFALLFLDLDNFKSINDSLGHTAGDSLIRQMARRLSAGLRDGDTVSRHGGDEFLIILSDVDHPDAVVERVQALVQAMAEPVQIDEHEVAVSASVGIALYPDDARDFDELLKKADMAMYRAKDAGRNTFRFFDEHMQNESMMQLRLRNGLRKALEFDELHVHFQSQIHIASGRPYGVEALLRWRHPELGEVPPTRFIPVAEESGVIVPIGAWVLREACRQAVQWQQAGWRDLVMSVNVSAIQLKRGGLDQLVRTVLDETGLAPHCLELELTESILIKDSEKTLDMVSRLKQMGVKLAIDDFGTGYSSMAYLKRLQVDRLKIDQSFVRDVSHDAENTAIVRAIIQMAHGLNLDVVAEGVEDAATMDRLRQLGCDHAQGFLIARPRPAEQFSPDEFPAMLTL